MNIGEKIKNLRKSLNYSQEEFGKMIGLSRSAICGIENETRNIPTRTIKLISNTFSVSEEWLISNDDERKKIVENFNSKVNHEKVVAQVDTIEKVGNNFGNEYVTILQSFDELNDKGKTKAIDIVDDLTLIPKYKKEPSSDDSK